MGAPSDVRNQRTLNVEELLTTVLQATMGRTSNDAEGTTLYRQRTDWNPKTGATAEWESQIKHLLHEPHPLLRASQSRHRRVNTLQTISKSEQENMAKYFGKTTLADLEQFNDFVRGLTMGLERIGIYHWLQSIEDQREIVQTAALKNLRRGRTSDIVLADGAATELEKGLHSACSPWADTTLGPQAQVARAADHALYDVLVKCIDGHDAAVSAQRRTAALAKRVPAGHGHLLFATLLNSVLGSAASGARALYAQIIKLDISDSPSGPQNPHQLCEVLLALVEQLRLCGQTASEDMLVQTTINKIDQYLLNARYDNVHDQQYLQAVAKTSEDVKKNFGEWSLLRLSHTIDEHKHRLDDAKESAAAAADDGDRYAQYISSILDNHAPTDEHGSRNAKKRAAAKHAKAQRKRAEEEAAKIAKAQRKRADQEAREAEEVQVHYQQGTTAQAKTKTVRFSGDTGKKLLFHEKDRWSAHNGSKQHCPCCGRKDHNIAACKLFCRQCGPNCGHTTADCPYPNNRICFYCGKREKDCKGTPDEHKPPSGQPLQSQSAHCYANCPLRKRGAPRAFQSPERNKLYYTTLDSLTRADSLAASTRAWDESNAVPDREDETEPVLITNAQLAAAQELASDPFETWEEVGGDSERIYMVSASSYSGTSGRNAQYAGKQLGSKYRSNTEGDGPGTARVASSGACRWAPARDGDPPERA
ncbi:MAG: hypothetical protein CMK50_00675 [Propionibacteriaceae bacterium]|nr:hypothetical protein [Propionibacteriaceae bacterium]